VEAARVERGTIAVRHQRAGGERSACPSFSVAILGDVALAPVSSQALEVPGGVSVSAAPGMTGKGDIPEFYAM
jgi:hypothetical protein